MNFNNFTTKSQEIIQKSQFLAQEFGHSKIENDDLKIGLRIFLVFSSIIATCVKIFGACIPIATPQHIDNKIKIL